MNATIRHDMASKLAYELVEMIASCLRQEEQLEALHEFYAVIKSGLDEYDAKNAETTRQLATPNRNVGG